MEKATKKIFKFKQNPSSVFCLLSSDFRLLSSDFRLLSSDFRLLSSVFCLLTSVFLFLPTTANANFDFNPNCQEAMRAVLDLRLKDARILIANEKKINPENAYWIYLEHYAESIELIVTEDEKIYEKLIDSYEDRMEEMDRLDNGSPDNSWLQAEMLFHTGLSQIKYGSRISGASKILGSYKLIRKNREKYPQFWQNQKLTGMYNIILDFVPPFMRWATDMFGFTGNAEMGLYQLEQYCEKAENTPGLAEESIIITNLGYKLALKEDEGFRFLARQDEKLISNTLVKYLYAISASFTYQNDLALKALGEIDQDKLQVKFQVLSYITGRCKLNHLEADASRYFEYYLTNYTGTDYKKDACNRLSYSYLIRGDQAKFLEFRAKVATVGQDLRDRDQEAILESKSGIVPHVGLLKARFLCDGGYFKESLEIMNSIEPDMLTDVAYLPEYHYRLGRILQLSNHPDQAIPELSAAYDKGKNLPCTFAARAALYLGKIYEDRKDYALANEWYKRSIQAFSSDHTTEGVKDMAEKGVKRIKTKL